MTKSEIIDLIANGTGLTKIETEAVVNGFIAIVAQGLKEEKNIEIRGFGSFKVQHRSGRRARNPRTGEEVDIEPRYVPAFRPSREFREAVDEAAKRRRDA